jgi:hypothetical protein
MSYANIDSAISESAFGGLVFIYAFFCLANMRSDALSILLLLPCSFFYLCSTAIHGLSHFETPLIRTFFFTVGVYEEGFCESRGF